jgi:CHAD domain-containing protein
MFVFSILNNEKLSLSVKRILNEQFDYTIYNCNIIDEININYNIHEIRKSFKRIRAVLRLLKYVITPEKYNKENILIRELSFKLSKVRDLQVFEEIIKDIALNYDKQFDNIFFTEILKHITKNKSDNLNRLIKTKTFKFISQKLIQEKNFIKNINYELITSNTITNGILNTYSNALKQFNILNKNTTDYNLHETRKKIKYLMYLIYIIKCSSKNVLTTYYNNLKLAETLLGDDHNLSELMNYINKISDQNINKNGLQLFTKIVYNNRIFLQNKLWDILPEIFIYRKSDLKKIIINESILSE